MSSQLDKSKTVCTFEHLSNRLDAIIEFIEILNGDVIFKKQVSDLHRLFFNEPSPKAKANLKELFRRDLYSPKQIKLKRK